LAICTRKRERKKGERGGIETLSTFRPSENEYGDKEERGGGGGRKIRRGRGRGKSLDETLLQAFPVRRVRRRKRRRKKRGGETCNPMEKVRKKSHPPLRHDCREEREGKEGEERGKQYLSQFSIRRSKGKREKGRRGRRGRRKVAKNRDRLILAALRPGS